MHIYCDSCCFLTELKMGDNDQSKEASDRSDLISDDGKNSKSIVCQRCRSKVLCPGMASLAEKEVHLLLQSQWAFVLFTDFSILNRVERYQ